MIFRRIPVLSVFPGLGKTFCLNNSAYKCSDSDSTKWSWVYEDGHKTKERNPDFPKNYVDHIKRLIKSDNYEFIFASSHYHFKKELERQKIPFISIYPEKSCKEFFLENLRNRRTGISKKEFVEEIDKHWDLWIPEDGDETKRNVSCYTEVFLEPGVWLSDALQYLTYNFYDPENTTVHLYRSIDGTVKPR